MRPLLGRLCLGGLLWLGACGGGRGGGFFFDLGRGSDDAGVVDASVAQPDFTGTTVDLAEPPPDFTIPDDLSPPPDDLTKPPDLAPLSPSAQIQLVRDAIDQGGGGPGFSIDGVLVTYVKPLIGTDVAGFFVQADQMGPALFVAVDPATLQPAPSVRDRVSFHVSAWAKSFGLRQATAIDSYIRLSQNNSIAGLVQDVTNAADLVVNVDNYESELISATGTFSGPFVASALGFVAANFDTNAIAGNPLLRFRTPTAVRDILDLTQGCSIRVSATPLWRFNTTVEPSAWGPIDLVVMSCPAPRVVSAAALSATSVQVGFDRNIDVNSVNAFGNQFTFSGGLTATGATASGKQVTVSTSFQTSGAAYIVNVDPTVRDTRGVGVDQNNNQATFSGYQSGAVLLVNEVNPNLVGGTDLVELRVVQAGSVSGMLLQQDVLVPVTLATLPNVSLSVGDLIVVHMTPTIGVTTETFSNGDCFDAACFPGAWDVAGAAMGITFSNRVLVVKSAGGLVQDAVPFVKTNLGTPPGAFPADLQTLQANGWWLPADCGGAPCTYTSTPTAQAVSADWTAVSNSVLGISVQRRAGMFDTNMATDWQVAQSTWGGANL